jgi:hypothetical protein
MYSSILYLPENLRSIPLYTKYCEILDHIIDERYSGFKDVFNKVKTPEDMDINAIKALIEEQGYSSLINVLELTDNLIKKIVPFLPLISALKGTTQGLVLCAELLGGTANVSSWVDLWNTHQDSRSKFQYWVAGKAYTEGDHVMGLLPDIIPDALHDTRNGLHYIYECDVAGISGLTEPAWNNTPAAFTTDNTITWKCLDPNDFLSFDISWSYSSDIFDEETLLNFKKFLAGYIYCISEKFLIGVENTFAFAGPADPALSGFGDTTLTLTPWTPFTNYYKTGDYPSTSPYQVSIVIPTTPNGYWYECITTGISGSIEPTWPTNEEETVFDGTAVFACRSYGDITDPIQNRSITGGKLAFLIS